MQRLTTISPAQNALIKVDPLAASFDTLVTEAKQQADQNRQQHLVELRKSLVNFIKKQVALLAKDFSKIIKQHEKYLFDLVAADGCLQRISDNGPTQAQWDDLIHFLKTTKIISASNKGFKLSWAIRHEFIVVFQEDSPLCDNLDTVIHDINNRKSFTEADQQLLIDHLYQLSYYIPNPGNVEYDNDNKEPLTIENIKALMPACEILIEKGLFSKANFLRLILQPHYNTKIFVDREGVERCDYYSYYSCPFYLYPLIPHEFISRFITQMNAVNIVNQQNLEVLIKTLDSKTSMNPQTYAGWDPEHLLKAFLAWCENLKISKYNDKFQELMFAWRHQTELNQTGEAERARIDRANNVDLNAIKKEKIKQHLQQLFDRELTQAQLTAGDEKEPTEDAGALTLILGEDDNLRREYIEGAQQNIDAIANMQTILQEDKAASGDNLTQMVIHAERAEELTEAYLLVKETGAFQTPQETFDAVVKVAENSAAVSAVIKWLPRQDYSAETIQTILDEAFYAEDFIAVTQFEEKNFKAVDQDNKNITSQYLFATNFSHKKEYLHSLAKIYKFVETRKLSGGSMVGAMLIRLPLSKALAALLEAIPAEEKVDEMKMTELISQCDQSEFAMRKKLATEVEKRIPDKIKPNILKYKNNLSVDFMSLANGYLLLKQNRLLQKWEYVIAESENCPIQLASTYATELASCLVNLHEKQILLPENAALLLLRREVSMAVTTILLKMHECGELNHENREKLKLNINRAVQISRYCQQMDTQQFKQLLTGNADAGQDIKSLVNEHEWYELNDDENGQPKAMVIKHEDFCVDNASDDEDEAEEIVIPAKTVAKPVNTSSVTSTTPAPLANSDETAPLISPRELIQRCRADYDNTFFGVSNFSGKLAANQIDKDNMQQMITYMKENPRSRTTRVYINLYVEKLKPGAYKNFWQKYLKSYTFSFYQKSDLINKFLEGSISKYQDIVNHAISNKSNRTTKLLRK